jgi:hypothetical protein
VLNKRQGKTMQINEENYEDLMLSWLDGELEGSDLDAMKQFLRDHPEKKKELETLRMTILPQEEMPFPGRQLLYRERKLKWFMAAAAAAAAVLLALFLLPSRSPSLRQAPTVAATTRASAPGHPALPSHAMHRSHASPVLHASNTDVVKPAAPAVPLAGAGHKPEHKAVSATGFAAAAGAPPLSHPVRQRQNKSPQISETRAPENETPLTALPPLSAPSDLHPPASVPIAVNAPALPAARSSAQAHPHQVSALPSGKATLATIGEARQKMDHTLTEKIGEIQYKMAHPFALLKGREIRIGNVSFAFNK